MNIATQLIQRYKIKPEKIAILSQYRAQCHKIAESLAQKHQPNVHVSTVITAQGKSAKLTLYQVWSFSLMWILFYSQQHNMYDIKHILDGNEFNIQFTRQRKWILDKVKPSPISVQYHIKFLFSILISDWTNLALSW